MLPDRYCAFHYRASGRGGGARRYWPPEHDLQVLHAGLAYAGRERGRGPGLASPRVLPMAARLARLLADGDDLADRKRGPVYRQRYIGQDPGPLVSGGAAYAGL